MIKIVAKIQFANHLQQRSGNLRPRHDQKYSNPISFRNLKDFVACFQLLDYVAESVLHSGDYS
jgi:hypothetical protein